MATDDLKARMADVATFGYMPAAARLALQQGVKRIEALEAQLAARDAEIAACEPYLKPEQTPAERMKQDKEEILGLMKLLEKTKWALHDAVTTNVENCRQRDWWKHAHTTVEAELTSNERQVDDLKASLTDVAWGLDTAKNALAWAARRMACPEYGNVVQNDANNAGRVLSRANDALASFSAIASGDYAKGQTDAQQGDA